MNATKFNKYLKKIKSFGDLVEDIENLSLIEKDLLKDYTKKLYEAIDEKEDNSKPVKKAKKNKKNNTLEKAEKLKEISEDKVEISKTEEVSFDTPKIKEEITKVEVIKEEVAKEIVNEEKIEVIPNVSNDLLDLFEVNDSNELSHKLSHTPIKNLTKSFSINERIFTVKELFGGNKDIFEKSLEDLDKFNSLEDAKNYLLTNVVNEYGWDAPKMLKKVNEFVKKVKRRYL